MGLLTCFIQAGPTGARQPTALELEVATIQGKTFYERVSGKV